MLLRQPIFQNTEALKKLYWFVNLDEYFLSLFFIFKQNTGPIF